MPSVQILVVLMVVCSLAAAEYPIDSNSPQALKLMLDGECHCTWYCNPDQCEAGITYRRCTWGAVYCCSRSKYPCGIQYSWGK
ncbi:hypothetical protein DPMN_112045 [Dreissena polymorpha]|uniref:Uncharacterized protein n=1 Tax=Dreissena polymorpha TaxID=45954 RepID=A0A9D4QPD9_DREPO|nr:hypothetical protein DPMN_112045 [Dreissena polymorpha]